MRLTLVSAPQQLAGHRLKASTCVAGDPAPQQLAGHRLEASTGSRRWRHEVLFDRLVARLVSQKGFDGPAAVRAVDAAWGFLELCAVRPELQLSPSPQVDAIWHETLLFTRQYRELCAALGLRQGIIHHEPFDEPGGLGGGAGATVAAFIEAGIRYDPEFWPSGQLEPCAQCGDRPGGDCAAACGAPSCNSGCYG